MFGQVFCYYGNIKKGSARFPRLIGYFKLFVEEYMSLLVLMFGKEMFLLLKVD